MEVPWRREPLKEEGMEGWGVAQRMGALEGEGSWKAEGDPRRWRGPLSGANLSLEGGGDPGGRRGPWRAKGIPGECLESGGDPREQREGPKGGVLDLGPQNTPQGQVCWDLPNAMIDFRD